MTPSFLQAISSAALKTSAAALVCSRLIAGTAIYRLLLMLPTGVLAALTAGSAQSPSAGKVRTHSDRG